MMRRFQGGRTGLSFVRSSTKQSRNSGFPYFDFMSVTGCAPWPVNSFGFDMTPGVNTLQLIVTGPTFDDYYAWSQGEIVNPNRNPVGFFRTRTIIENFAAYSSSGGVVTTYKSAYVTKQTYYLFFKNQNDLMQVKVNSDNASTVGYIAYPATNETTPSSDITITGFPVTYDSSIFQTSLDENGNAYTISRPSSGNPTYLAYNQETCPAPTVELTGSGAMLINTLTQYFQTKPPANGGPDLDRTTDLPTTTVTEFSDWISWDDWQALCASIENFVPLKPDYFFTGREGPVYFNFYGTSSVQPDGNLIPSNAVYSDDGTYNITGLTAETIYGIQLGPNDDNGISGLGIGGSTAPGPIFWPTDSGGTPVKGSEIGYDMVWAQIYAWDWTSGPQISYIRPVKVDGGSTDYSPIYTLAKPSCTAFEPSGTSVIFHGGSFWNLDVWAAGATYAVGHEVTNIPDWAGTPAKNSHINAVVQSITTGIAGGSEPAWPGVGSTVVDGGVTWLIQAIHAPVTAKITLTHFNQLVVFETKDHTVLLGNPIVTIVSAGDIFPAANIWTDYLDSYPMNGFAKMKSLIRVPASFDPTQDPTYETYIASGYTNTKNLLADALYSIAGNDRRLGEYRTLTSGTFTFTDALIYGNLVNFPMGYGIIKFGPTSLITPTTQAATAGSAGDSTGAADSQSNAGSL